MEDMNQSQPKSATGDQIKSPLSVRRHLLIAGTGRAGTSFLVRFLAGLGLQTTLSKGGSGAFWNEEANAGLEDIPVAGASGLSGLPYVIKNPWVHEVIDDLLAQKDLRLDAVIVPLRELMEAASSRVVLERRALYEQHPWMAGLSAACDTWGTTAGGVQYSLHELDQARLLAVGLHRLLERLVKAEVPVVLLSFPRLVEDPDYLFRQLRQVLPPNTTLEQARAVHQGLADPAKVRVGGELQRGAAGAESGGDRLDNIALRRELQRVRAASVAAQTEAAQLRAWMTAVLQSRSWRITTPLRKLQTLRERLRRKP